MAQSPRVLAAGGGKSYTQHLRRLTLLHSQGGVLREPGRMGCRTVRVLANARTQRGTTRTRPSRFQVVNVGKIAWGGQSQNGRVYVTREEADRLLANLPPHLASMAAFSLATGLRRFNVTGMQWSQVDLVRRVAWIHPDLAKARRAIPVPLTPKPWSWCASSSGMRNLAADHLAPYAERLSALRVVDVGAVPTEIPTAAE